MQSQQLDQLSLALSEFQSELTHVHKDKTAKAGSFSYRYADLSSVWDLIRPLLVKHGLSVSQAPLYRDGFSVLRTTLMHKSGQWMAGELLLNPVKNDPQSMGSAITYARRYALCSMTGVVADEDDDAQIAQRKGPKQSGERDDDEEPGWFKTEPSTAAIMREVEKQETDSIPESQYRLFEEKLSLVGNIEDLVAWWKTATTAKKRGLLTPDQYANLTKLKDAHKRAFESEGEREPGSEG